MESCNRHQVRKLTDRRKLLNRAKSFACDYGSDPNADLGALDDNGSWGFDRKFYLYQERPTSLMNPVTNKVVPMRHGSDEFAYSELLRDLWPEMSSLQQTALKMYRDGQTWGEIGEHLGMSADAIRKNMERLNSKARNLHGNPKNPGSETVSIRACADDSQEIPFESNTIRRLFACADEGDRSLLTSVQVAAHLNIPEGTLRQWRCLGVGPAFHKIGRGVRYTREDIADYVSQSRRVPSVRENTEGYRGSY